MSGFEIAAVVFACIVLFINAVGFAAEGQPFFSVMSLLAMTGLTFLVP